MLEESSALLEGRHEEMKDNAIGNGHWGSPKGKYRLSKLTSVSDKWTGFGIGDSALQGLHSMIRFMSLLSVARQSDEQGCYW